MFHSKSNCIQKRIFFHSHIRELFRSYDEKKKFISLWKNMGYLKCNFVRNEHTDFTWRGWHLKMPKRHCFQERNRKNENTGKVHLQWNWSEQKCVLWHIGWIIFQRQRNLNIVSSSLNKQILNMYIFR